ncbi:MAG TPA: amino acid ABC transporter permease [Actinopolymorphaceae bacterium]
MTVTAEPRPRKKLSPRQRAQRIRWAQYAVLIAAAIALVLAIDWGTVGPAFFGPDLIVRTLTGGVFIALVNTIIYTAGGFVLGLLAGTLFALMKLSSVGPYRWIATAYIEFFRGLPAIIVFIGFALLPLVIGFNVPGGTTGTAWLALGIVGAAYMAETIRAGIQAVPKGQVEAARSLGMSAGTATRKIVLPQAFRIVLPPLTNELILLVKDSSLIFIAGVSTILGIGGMDLTGFGRETANSEANLTPLVVAGFCYLLITLPLSILVRRLEASGAKAR